VAKAENTPDVAETGKVRTHFMGSQSDLDLDLDLDI
jgi:hypothetical protein